MIAFYLNRIKLNKMTLADVPPKWKENVRKRLED